MTGLRRFLAIVGLIALLVLAGGTLMLMAGHARYGFWSTGMPFGRPLLMGGYGGAYGPPPESCTRSSACCCRPLSPRRP